MFAEFRDEVRNDPAHEHVPVLPPASSALLQLNQSGLVIALVVVESMFGAVLRALTDANWMSHAMDGLYTIQRMFDGPLREATVAPGAVT